VSAVVPVVTAAAGAVAGAAPNETVRRNELKLLLGLKLGLKLLVVELKPKDPPRANRLREGDRVAFSAFSPLLLLPMPPLKVARRPSSRALLLLLLPPPPLGLRLGLPPKKRVVDKRRRVEERASRSIGLRTRSCAVSRRPKLLSKAVESVGLTGVSGSLRRNGGAAIAPPTPLLLPLLPPLLLINSCAVGAWEACASRAPSRSCLR
jgi:hypothetical protein